MYLTGRRNLKDGGVADRAEPRVDLHQAGDADAGRCRRRTAGKRVMGVKCRREGAARARGFQSVIDAGGRAASLEGHLRSSVIEYCFSFYESVLCHMVSD